MLMILFLTLFSAVTSAVIPNRSNSIEENSVTIPEFSMRPHGFSGVDPKRLAVERFKALISDFLTDAQLSKSIDAAAVGMHKGTPLDQVLDDVYVRLRKMLSTQQIKDLVAAQKGMIAALGENAVRTLKSRVRRMIVYSFDPAAEQIHQHATRPSMAFTLIAETLNERFVGSVKALIRDVLTDKEFDAFQKFYSPKILKLETISAGNEEPRPVPM